MQLFSIFTLKWCFLEFRSLNKTVYYMLTIVAFTENDKIVFFSGWTFYRKRYSRLLRLLIPDWHWRHAPKDVCDSCWVTALFIIFCHCRIGGPSRGYLSCTGIWLNVSFCPHRWPNPSIFSCYHCGISKGFLVISCTRVPPMDTLGLYLPAIAFHEYE